MNHSHLDKNDIGMPIEFQDRYWSTQSSFQGFWKLIFYAVCWIQCYHFLFGVFYYYLYVNYSSYLHFSFLIIRGINQRNWISIKPTHCVVYRRAGLVEGCSAPRAFLVGFRKNFQPLNFGGWKWSWIFLDLPKKKFWE